MSSKDLIFVANILLDCEEAISKGNNEIEHFIKQRCNLYKINSIEQDIIKIVANVSNGYNIGNVEYRFSEESTTG